MPIKSQLVKSLEVDYTKLRYVQQPFLYNSEALPGFSLQTSQYDAIYKVVKNLENHLGRKLRILEIGSAQGFFGLQFAKEGHQIISIDWEDENVQFVKKLRLSIPDPISYEIFRIDLDRILEINETEFDLSISMGSLVQVYRTLNTSAQGRFFEFIKKNSKVAIWDIPIFEENASWNWAINQNPLEDFKKDPFLFEIGRYKKHNRGAKWPLILTSENFAYTENQFFQFDTTQIHFKHPFSDGTENNRRTINLGEKILKFEFREGIQENRVSILGEKRFLESKRIIEMNEILFPRVISANIGEYVSQFSRETVEGIRLDLALNSQNSNEILGKFASLTVSLAKSGIFPNDLRPWNIIWDGETCKLIDFSSSNFFDDDESGIPQFISFLATVEFIKLGNFKAESWNMNRYISNFNKIYSSLGNLKHFLFDFTWKEIFSEKTFVESILKLDSEIAIQEVIQILKKRFPNCEVAHA